MPTPPSRPVAYVCPICSTAVLEAAENGGAAAGSHRYRPFCSVRCQRIDLGNWLGERYTVPGDPPPEEPETSEGGSGRPASDGDLDGDPRLLPS